MSGAIEQAETLRQALLSRDLTELERVIRELSEAEDLADALDEMSPAELQGLLDALGDEDAGEMLSLLDPEDAADLLESLAIGERADILEAMSPDDATDIITLFEGDGAEEVLIAMDPVEASAIRELAQYPPDTAGGRMTPAFVAIDPSLRADQAVVALREVAQRAETIHYVYVTDDDDRLLGVLALRNLVLSPPETSVAELMSEDVITVDALTDQEEAARLLQIYDLFALPVIDEHNRLLGIITADDVADILEEEATEDIARLGGSQPLTEPYLRASPFLLWRKRIVWLLVLFAGASYTTTVLRYFEDSIEAVVMLSFFIPLLIGTGGNVGSQIVTTLVRAISVEGLGLEDIARVLAKELRVALLMGAVMASVMMLVAGILGAGLDLAIVVSSAVFCIVIWATLIGAMLPLVLRRFRVDPAVVSAPLITTIVDGTGLIIYFTIARLVLELS